MRLTHDQVLAWRLHRHLLEPRSGHEAGTVVRRLAGVQAQVASAAEQAVAVRGATGGLADAVAGRTLVRTWAMRGTLHVLDLEHAPAFLALLAAARTWEKGSWQRTFATAAQMAAITEAAVAVLADATLTRDELSTAIIDHTGDATLAEPLRSGWGALLKPLAWQGLLCNADGSGNKVTFTSPAGRFAGWPGLPEPDAAAAVAIPAYLGAHGPATAEVFDQWLLRGATPKRTLRRWFTELTEAGVLAVVDVDGEPAYARADDLDELAAATPSTAVHLLPAFDQWVLAPGTADTRIVPAEHRADVSRAAGWIAPVVVAGGRVIGTWEPGPVVTLFPEAEVAPDALAAAVAVAVAVAVAAARAP